MGSCEIEAVSKVEELGLKSPSSPSHSIANGFESLGEEFGNLRLEEKSEEKITMKRDVEKCEGEEDDTNLETGAAAIKNEEHGDLFQYPQRRDENTGWDDDADVGKSEEKFETGAHGENTRWEDNSDPEKHSASFKEAETSDGFHYPERLNENRGRVVDANPEKYEGGGDHENTGWGEDGAGLDKGSDCYKEEKGEWLHYPSIHVESTGWEDDADVGISEERFGVGSDNENKRWEEDASLQKGKSFEYPHRPGEPECSYYMRTGNCRYGSNCKFSHPPDRNRNQARSWDTSGPIQSYSMPGGSRYGRHGNYREKSETGVVELNFSGLPLRPGQRECPYYIRTGSCKFSTNCRFHHPDPTAVAGQDPLSGYENGGSPQRFASRASQLPELFQPLQKTSNEPVPFSNASQCYLPAMLFPPHGLHPSPDINSYQAPVNPSYSSEKNIPYPLASTWNGSTSRADGPMHQQAQTEEYPERPGQPECQYYMRYGDCKFRSACRYNHPSAANSIGHVARAGGPNHEQARMEDYPERPGQPECQYYMRYGDCKFRSACRFHHPSAPNSNGHVTRADGSTANADGLVHQQAQMDEYPRRFVGLECPYFMKHGDCKFGSACKFPHPSASTFNGPTEKGYGLIRHEEQMEEYPERPGEPECSFFMKFGECKFRSTCRYHHPKARLPRVAACIISPIGLPLRPDQPICSHYSRFGICKFGPSCKFDHPMDHGSSSSESARRPSRVSSPEGIRTAEDKTAGGNIMEHEPEW